MSHELVHAISIDLGLPAHFWNEGLAEALSDHAIAFKPSELASLLDVHPREYGYSIPGHFVRWLMVWGGTDAFVHVFIHGDFDSVYGMTLEDAERIYDAEAPEVLPAPFPCEGEPVLADDDGSFDIDVELDCEADTSVRFPPQHESSFLAESRIIEVMQPTTFSLFAEGGEVDQVLIGGCQSTPGDRVDQLGDVPNETVDEPAGRYAAYWVDEEYEVFLPAWTYRVSLVSLDEPTHMRLTMTPL